MGSSLEKGRENNFVKPSMMFACKYHAKSDGYNQFFGNAKYIKQLGKLDGKGNHRTSAKKLCVCAVNYRKTITSFTQYFKIIQMDQIVVVMEEALREQKEMCLIQDILPVFGLQII